MTVRILQFGTTGQLGRELLAQAKDFDVEVTALSRAEADFGDPRACAAAVSGAKADLVVIAAAYTAVDQAETDTDQARKVNATAPHSIALAAAARDIPVVWISTDYVFPGDKGAPYVETDPVGPINAYGATKLEGEEGVLSVNPRSLVLRASWVVSSHGKNFVKTMLRLADEGKPLKIVADQYGRPTAARDLARFILSQAGRLAVAKAGDPVFGVFHFANAGEVSWKGFAEGIFSLAYGAKAPPVAPAFTADWAAPAKRPLRGTLDTSKLERVFGVTLEPWHEAVGEIVRELRAPERTPA